MEPAFLRPPPLQPGSVVRLIRPAGAYDPEALHEGLALVRAAGLRPVLGPQDLAPSAYYAAAREGRCQDLLLALNDPAAAALWAVRGGAGTAQLLPHIEAALQARLARAPLWLVGFSDITTLHGRFGAHGLMSLHGANLVNLPAWTPGARDELWQALMGPPQAPAPLQGRLLLGRDGPGGAPGPGIERAADGDTVTGPLVGGNLTVLASLAGTGALPPWRGCVVFLEDIDERPYRLDRCLQQLVAAAAFEGARAVLFGQLTRCDGVDRAGAPYPPLQLLGPTLAPLGLPVLCDLPVGHEPSSRPLLLGAQATVHLRRATVTVRP